MIEKKVAWTIYCTVNKKWLETYTELPNGSIKCTWTKFPSCIHYEEKEITKKPVNCKIVQVEVQKFYQINRENLFPQIVATEWQHLADEGEYKSYEDALEVAITENKEMIKEHKNIAKALTDWNNQHK